MTPTQWGFMGCGNMANDFASAMQLLPKGENEIAAVGARQLERSKAFADRFQAKKSFEGYESVANCPDVEIVYVNVEIAFHYNCVKLAINAGKSVLCETPLGMNARQVKEMIQLARQKGVFLMEAHWGRCCPIYEEIRQALKDGRIGEPKFIQAMFGVAEEESPDKYYSVTGESTMDKSAGNSAILACGTYLVNLPTMLFDGQRPESIEATGLLDNNGIDIVDCVTLTYKNGAVVQLMTSTFALTLAKATRAIVFGTKGSFELPEVFYCPSKMIMNSKLIEYPLPEAKDARNAYPNFQALSYEIQHVRECLLKGLKESPLMPLDHSEVIISVLDEVRRQVGCTYPDSL